ESKPPIPVPIPPEPKPNLLTKFCLAIQEHEGWLVPGKDYPKGSRSYRNNNPGNIKYGDFAKSCGAIRKDDKYFAVFESYLDGFNAPGFDFATFQWDELLKVAVSAFAVYMSKNLLTTSNGKFGGVL